MSIISEATSKDSPFTSTTPLSLVSPAEPKASKQDQSATKGITMWQLTRSYKQDTKIEKNVSVVIDI